MSIEIRKQFETRNGKQVEVVGKLITEKEVWLDGNTDTVPTCETELNVYVDGKMMMGGMRELTSKEKAQIPVNSPVTYTHVIGQLALTPEWTTIIKSVKSEIESNPIWIAHNAKIEANYKALAEIERIRQSHPGWSKKTQSYSYGDEEA